MSEKICKNCQYFYQVGVLAIGKCVIFVDDQGSCSIVDYDKRACECFSPRFVNFGDCDEGFLNK